jgi:hypothetical protein
MPLQVRSPQSKVVIGDFGSALNPPVQEPSIDVRGVKFRARR